MASDIQGRQFAKPRSLLLTGVIGQVGSLEDSARKAAVVNSTHDCNGIMMTIVFCFLIVYIIFG